LRGLAYATINVDIRGLARGYCVDWKGFLRRRRSKNRDSPKSLNIEDRYRRLNTTDVNEISLEILIYKITQAFLVYLRVIARAVVVGAVDSEYLFWMISSGE